MRQKVTTVEEIKETALAIAVKDGIDRLSVRRLAQACGIAVGSMYNYYPNKEALLDAVSSAFWEDILRGQENIYRRGMGFVAFLEQYYGFLYSRLLHYDRGWLARMNGSRPQMREALLLFERVLEEDRRVNPAIWNMELSRQAFLQYVFVNVIALLQAGEKNCRFFIYLLERLLYHV